MFEAVVVRGKCTVVGVELLWDVTDHPVPSVCELKKLPSRCAWPPIVYFHIAQLQAVFPDTKCEICCIDAYLIQSDLRYCLFK